MSLLSRYDSKKLTEVNTTLRRVDLMAKMLSPIAVGSFVQFSRSLGFEPARSGAIGVIALALATTPPEYIFLRSQNPSALDYLSAPPRETPRGHQRHPFLTYTPLPNSSPSLIFNSAQVCLLSTPPRGWYTTLSPCCTARKASSPRRPRPIFCRS